MRKIIKISIFFLILVINSGTSFAQGVQYKSTLNFDLTGLNIKGAEISIMRFQPDSSIIFREIQKIPVKMNKFTFSLNLSEPISVKLLLKRQDSTDMSTGSLVLFNEPVFIKNDNNYLEVKSNQTDFYQAHGYNLYLSVPYNLAVTSTYSTDFLRKSYEIPIPQDLSLYGMQMEHERDVISQVRLYRNYFNTLTGLYKHRNSLSLKTLDTCYYILYPVFNQSEYLKKLKEYIEQSKLLIVGKVIPSFFVLDRAGNKIVMNNFYGNYKYTLIDFWASWCGPCRKEMKVFKESYSSFDTSKIQILSISLDTDSAKWHQASVEENINWKNYYDSKGFNGNVAKIFTINSIPSNILLNEKGEVVKRDISPDELNIFLKQNQLLK